MENLKIKVNSKAESKEAQELFFELGYEWYAHGKNVSHLDVITTGDFGYLVAWKTGYFSKHIIQMGRGKEDAKEITLPQLRDMVVLKRKPMKEYPNPNQNYELVLCDEKDKGEGFIEVPEGAECAMLNSDCSLNFFKNINGELHYYNDATDGNWFKSFFGIYGPVVWQRHTQPEELPFIDDEPSLNDQYAEIEKVRQSKIEETLAERQAQYGCFEDVAFVTESIMGILSKVRGNRLQDLPNTHRMALYMIASKMARIVNGDFNHLDSWHDIGGYAKLIEKLIEGE